MSKTKIESILKPILVLTLPSLIFLVIILELTFRFIIPASKKPNTIWNEAFNFIQMDNRPESGLYTLGSFTEQKGRWRINNYGWNSPIDYTAKRTKPRIAVIGDSFVEAMQVDIEKSFHGIIRDALPDHEVYNFGTSGAPLSHYLHLARYIKQEFDPDTYLFLLIHNDFDESINSYYPYNKHFMTLDIQSDSIKEIKANNPLANSLEQNAKRLIKKSALARYILYNLSSVKRSRHQKLKQQIHKGMYPKRDFGKLKPELELVVDYTFGQLQKELPDKKLIFVMNAPAQDIYNSHVENSQGNILNDIVELACANYGFDLLDLTAPFSNDFLAHKKSFHIPKDGHWNEYGHELVAKTILSQYYK